MLSLTEESEQGPFETSGLEEDFRAIVVANDDTGFSDLVVYLDDSLHQAFSTLPALIHDVHTRALREFVPCFTRIF